MIFWTLNHIGGRVGDVISSASASSTTVRIPIQIPLSHDNIVMSRSYCMVGATAAARTGIRGTNHVDDMDRCDEIIDIVLGTTTSCSDCLPAHSNVVGGRGREVRVLLVVVVVVVVGVVVAAVGDRSC